MSRFKVGDKVVLVDKHINMGPGVGTTGTVLAVTSNRPPAATNENLVSVAWDGWNGGYAVAPSTKTNVWAVDERDIWSVDEKEIKKVLHQTDEYPPGEYYFQAIRNVCLPTDRPKDVVKAGYDIHAEAMRLWKETK